MAVKKKVAVIGGGPGGYVAAIRAAQLGSEVTLVEKGDLGGTCLNVGCIPTKTLLHAAKLYQTVKHSADIGLEITGVQLNWQKVMDHKRKVVARLKGGVSQLLKSNGVRLLGGTGRLITSRKVEVINDDGGALQLDVDAVILATGSRSLPLPIKGCDLPGVITSDNLLDAQKLPESIVIIGGGVIGVELGTLLGCMGVRTSIVELLPEILPVTDREVAGVIKKGFLDLDLSVYTSAGVSQIRRKGDCLEVIVATKEGEKMLGADQVLIAAGRVPVTDGLNLDGIGINTKKGAITVNEYMETSVSKVYAVGDVTGGLMLAHKASAEGVIAAENAVLGNRARTRYQSVPSCIYGLPEAASVGLTEDEAKERGLAVKVGRFSFAGNSKALIEGDSSGFIKVVADPMYNQVLGVHMVGPGVTEMIGECALAINLEATVDEITGTIHPHPTVNEALVEAALAVTGNSIHWPKMR